MSDRNENLRVEVQLEIPLRPDVVVPRAKAHREACLRHDHTQMGMRAQCRDHGISRFGDPQRDRSQCYRVGPNFGVRNLNNRLCAA
jgi:hypothetical protein